MASIPTIEVFRDGNKLIVNACDLPQWEAQGWGAEVAAPTPEPPQGEGTPPEPKPKKK